LKKEREATLKQYETFYKTAETDEERSDWKKEIGALMALIYSGDELAR